MGDYVNMLLDVNPNQCCIVSLNCIQRENIKGICINIQICMNPKYPVITSQGHMKDNNIELKLNTSF